MKIYTKTGDSGETSLIGGARVKKDHLRIEAYGTVDELNACLGLVRDAAEQKVYEDQLMQIQNLLFSIGSNLAADDPKAMPLPQLSEESIVALEKAMDEMNEDLPSLRNFILPGGDLAASHCHLARTICRRAERRVVSLNEQAEVNSLIVRYLNRLSDYLFTLARWYTKRHGGKETLWKSGN